MKYYMTIAGVFAGLTVLFILLVMINQPFFNWVFGHHRNQLSWHIRSVFLIPFCYFSYSWIWASVMLSVFTFFTIMFWFDKPGVIKEQLVGILQYEKSRLTKSWTTKDVLMSLTVSLSFFLLALAFWERSLWMGLAVVILMAPGKILWSFKTPENQENRLSLRLFWD